MIAATRDMLPGEQVLFDYGVGYWVDDLNNRDYDKLPKDQRAFFDTMHAVVENYAWLSRITRQHRLSQAMRVGIIAFFLSQQCLGSCSINALAVPQMNPLVQYLSQWRLPVHPSEHSFDLVDEARVQNIERISSQPSTHTSTAVTISATDDPPGPLPDNKRHGEGAEVTEDGCTKCTEVTDVQCER